MWYMFFVFLTSSRTIALLHKKVWLNASPASTNTKQLKFQPNDNCECIRLFFFLTIFLYPRSLLNINLLHCSNNLNSFNFSFFTLMIKKIGKKTCICKMQIFDVVLLRLYYFQEHDPPASHEAFRKVVRFHSRNYHVAWATISIQMW